MKVLHVVSTISVGGTSKALMSLATGLQDKYGISSTIATTHPLVENVSREAIAFALHENVTVKQLAEIVLEGKFDLVHWWKNTGSGQFRNYIKTIGSKRPPLLITLCQVPVDPRHSLSRFEMEYADKIVFICKEAYHNWRVKAVPAEAKELIYFGTWSSRKDSVNLSAEEKDNSVFRFGRGSVLSKCPSGFLSTFKKIEIPESTFHIAGSGNDADRQRIEAEIRKTGLTDRVVLEGQFGQVEWNEFLHGLDVFLYQLPPRAFSAIDATIQDAMLAEIPVIYQGPPAPKELLVHGESGFVAGDEKEVIFYAQQLYHDPQLRKRIGVQGRRRIIDVFSFEKTIKKYGTIYRELCYPEKPLLRMKRSLSPIFKLFLLFDLALFLPFWIWGKLRERKTCLKEKIL
jgi:glycosyltransferase involved in cell wall biosynthesis